MAAFKDYYATLGVSKGADQKEIKSAFRKLAAKHHPDRNPDNPAAEDKFKEINEAYTVLSDEEKREFYDQYGTADGRPPFAGGAPGAGGFTGNFNPQDAADFSDFFQTLFGGAGFGGTTFSTGGRGGYAGGDPFAGYRQPQPQMPRQEAELELDLITAYRGGNLSVTLNGRPLDVTIPGGAHEGSKLRLKGQAPSGGDLYLKLKFATHPTFKLDGDKVRVFVNVPDYRAALGGPVRVPTLDGEVEMTLPAGISSGRSLRLKGQGWPKKDGTRGDAYAEIRVTVPKGLSDEQRELYEKLKDVSEAAVVS